MTDSQAARLEASLMKVGAVEGTSMLLLLGVAMPLKYVAHQPMAVTIVGSAHGVLWLAYLVVLAIAWRKFGWSFKTVVLGGIASVLPFGPWVFHSYLSKHPTRTLPPG